MSERRLAVRVTKSTPGPWTVREDSYGNWTGRICDLGWGIVVTVASGPPDDIPGEEESLANARLVSAAPDLLAAAKMAEEALPIAIRWALREDPEQNPNVLALRAAIAKAEGRQ